MIMLIRASQTERGFFCGETPACHVINIHSQLTENIDSLHHNQHFNSWKNVLPFSCDDCVRKTGEDGSGNNRLITLATLQPMRDRKGVARIQIWEERRCTVSLSSSVIHQEGGEGARRSLLDHCVCARSGRRGETRSALLRCAGWILLYLFKAQDGFSCS